MNNKRMCAGMLLVFTYVLHASPLEEKRLLKSNMTEVYQVVPGETDTLGKMFQEGIFYGRLRFHSFTYQWDEEIAGKSKNHQTLGVGGSIVYQSARYHGFAVTAGLYTSQNPWHMEDEDAVYYKAGKGVLDRYKVLTQGEYGLTSLAQAYVSYTHDYGKVVLGRQIFETLLTKSNDTKMIPNTFEGLSVKSDTLPHTKFTGGYFTAQKLRDHSTFHHLLAYGDDTTDPYAKWSENDDSAMHKGLTLSKLQALGIKDRLIVAQIENDTFEPLHVMANYTSVPELVSLYTLQANYTVKFGKTWRVAPALRYLYQLDEGAGAIGGANLKSNTIGYEKSESVDGSLIAARMDFAYRYYKLRLGYSKVADRADLITPWRGFPTGGFTRAMAQYNWSANTETFMVRMDYDLDKAGIVPGMQAFARYAVQDFDDTKPGVQADSNVVTLDLLKRFETIPNLYGKIRVAHGEGDADTLAMDGSLKSDPSYDEIRIEFNYLF